MERHDLLEVTPVDELPHGESPRLGTPLETAVLLNHTGRPATRRARGARVDAAQLITQARQMLAQRGAVLVALADQGLQVLDLPAQCIRARARRAPRTRSRWQLPPRGAGQSLGCHPRLA